VRLVWALVAASSRLQCRPFGDDSEAPRLR
jgi:hypothetical protein